MSIHHPEFYDLSKIDTDTLKREACILHYALYEQLPGQELRDELTLKAILEELKCRGHNIGWTGYTG